MIGLKFRLSTNEENLSLFVSARDTRMGRITAIKHGSGVGPIRTKLRHLKNGCGEKDVLPSGEEQEGGFLLLATKRWTPLSDLHKIYFDSHQFYQKGTTVFIFTNEDTEMECS